MNMKLIYHKSKFDLYRKFDRYKGVRGISGENLSVVGDMSIKKNSFLNSVFRTIGF